MENVQDKLMEQFQNMDRAYEAYAKAKGMNCLSLLVLEELWELGDGCTQKQISAETHYPKQAVNLVIKAFVQKGLVELREVPSNRKNKEIYCTAAGQQRCKEVVVPLLEQENAAMAAMGEAQSRKLLRLLELYGRQYCAVVERILK